MTTRKINYVTVDNFIDALSNTATLLAVFVKGTVCKILPSSGQILACKCSFVHPPSTQACQ